MITLYSERDTIYSECICTKKVLITLHVCYKILLYRYIWLMIMQCSVEYRLHCIFECKRIEITLYVGA